MENKRKNFGELTQSEKQKVIQFRRQNGELFTRTRTIVTIRLLTYFILIFIWSLMRHYSIKLIPYASLLWILIIFYSLVDSYILRRDNETWYYQNIDKLYENEILK